MVVGFGGGGRFFLLGGRLVIVFIGDYSGEVVMRVLRAYSKCVCMCVKKEREIDSESESERQRETTEGARDSTDTQRWMISGSWMGFRYESTRAQLFEVTIWTTHKKLTCSSDRQFSIL